MLSDLLATVAEGGKILLEEEEYLLARVEVQGRPMLAEISSGDHGGIPPGEWPSVSGILHADSEMQPATESGARILLFSLPHGAELYLQRIMRDGALTESRAMDVGRKVLVILRRLHDAGFRVGYLGPENVLVTPAGDHLILGGARGIPDTPFSPPEAVGARAQDPRSDVYALGLLMFRLLAGSDNRNVQIEAWNRLSPGLVTLLEKMVTPRSDDRYANLIVLSRKMATISPRKPSDAPKDDRTRRPAAAGGRKFPAWGWVIVALVLAVAAILIIDPGGGDGGRTAPVERDTTIPVQSIPDTLGIVDSTLITEPLPDPGWEPIIWISNGTGQPGSASEFRQGPVSGYSGVYACTGSRRSSSIVLVRREDPTLSLQDHERLYGTAVELASRDSTMSVLPVDITLLLGGDLVDDVVTPGVISHASSPAGTLYVDIANHGLEGAYGGAGAATWVRSVLNGGCVGIDGEEWMISVVDFRNGDMLNDELGIPARLDSTGFLYRGDLPVLSAAELEIRKAILESTTSEPSGPVLPEPPDIWILLGQ
jgi:hypothetical protein